MLSCKDVSRMVSESLDRKLSLYDRLRVKLHLLICNACQQMVKQMELLRSAFQRFGSTEKKQSHTEQGTLSKEARTRILERLQHAQHKHNNHE